MATYTVGGRGARNASGSRFVSNAGEKNSLMNQIMTKGFGSLGANQQAAARQMLSPDELTRALGGMNPSGSSGGSGSSSGGGGGLDANSLMELYQKGMGAGKAEGMSADDQIRLLKAGNEIDMESRRQQQQLQLEGQANERKLTQEARAKERETEDTLQRRQQTSERNSAMAAFKGL